MLSATSPQPAAARTVLPPYGDLWKVAVVDVNADPVTSEQRDQLFAWLTEHGVPYSQCRPTLVITQNGDGDHNGRLLLHVSHMAFDDNGRNIIDFAENRVHSVPLVVAIDDYPAWLVQASIMQESAAL